MTEETKVNTNCRITSMQVHRVPPVVEPGSDDKSGVATAAARNKDDLGQLAKMAREVMDKKKKRVRMAEPEEPSAAAKKAKVQVVSVTDEATTKADPALLPRKKKL